MQDQQQIIRRILLICADIASIVVALYGSLVLRFNGIKSIETQYILSANYLILILIIISIALLAFNKLYSSVWKYASIVEAKSVIYATIENTLLLLCLSFFTQNPLPRSCYFTYALLLLLFLCMSRFSYRFLRQIRKDYVQQYNNNNNNIMIIGAGDAGEKVLTEVINSSLVDKQVACLIDDDITKKGLKLHNVVVYGNRYKIPEAVKKYNIKEIYVTMPSASKKDLAEILNICKDTKCRVKRLPGIYQLVNNEIQLSSFKDVEVLDLLGRDQIEVNLVEITEYLTNKVVMVTGGGGSIGSELCRQIAKAKPKKLIIVDVYENNAYDIQLELKHDYPDLDLETLIASVRNTTKVNNLFETYHPDVVYHAAAHKHVPLMEDSPNEAIKNNVFGTLNVVQAADKYHTSKFVLISTDKAVNPTNIMGASKRMCEMIVQYYSKRSSTSFVAVRFGNVLGSNGSVIPLFKKQIQNGGPVTVTHKDIIRYFMTIPEAVSLVLQAGAYAKGGEIFVLDMGEPVKIDDMARNLIKLSGYEPDVDIKIEYTGLRPGEKMYEEMLMKEEGLTQTSNKLIFIGKQINVSDEYLDKLRVLKENVYNECTDVRNQVHEIVDTYKYNEGDN